MKKLFMLAFIFVFLFGFVSAVDTPISVITLSNHNITINILNPISGDALYTIEGSSKDDGNAYLSLVTNNIQDVNAFVIVRNSYGKIIKTKEFNGLTTGRSFTFNMKEEDPKPVSLLISNITLNNTVNVSKQNDSILNDSNKNDSTNLSLEKKDKVNSVSGSAVSGLNGDTGLIIGIVVVVIILLVVLFYVWKKYGKGDVGTISKPAKVGSGERDSDKRLKQTQRELEEAQREINRLKNRDKISNIERRIEEERKEIERLRKGY